MAYGIIFSMEYPEHNRDAVERMKRMAKMAMDEAELRVATRRGREIANTAHELLSEPYYCGKCVHSHAPSDPLYRMHVVYRDHSDGFCK